MDLIREKLIPIGILGAWLVATSYTIAALGELQSLQMTRISLPAVEIQAGQQRTSWDSIAQGREEEIGPAGVDDPCSLSPAPPRRPDRVMQVGKLANRMRVDRARHHAPVPSRDTQQLRAKVQTAR